MEGFEYPETAYLMNSYSYETISLMNEDQISVLVYPMSIKQSNFEGNFEF